METTGSKVLRALEPYDLEKQREGQYRANSPFRAGSNSHGFTLIIHADGEHGAWYDHVSGEQGSLYDLAKRLGLDITRTEYQVKPSKRAYAGIEDYAAAHGVSVEFLRRAGWSETTFAGKLALKFKTKTGLRWRLLQGKEEDLKSPYRNEPGRFKPCWYGLTEFIAKFVSDDIPLVICNGEISVVAAQENVIPAVCVAGGEKEIPDPLIDELKAFFSQKLPDVLIAADCDSTGRRVARTNQEKLIAAGFPSVKVIDLGFSKGGDLADLCVLYGLGALDVLLYLPELPAEVTPSTGSRSWQIFSREEIKKLPPPEWLLEGQILKRGITVLYGASGEYKTYLALDQACHLAEKHRVVYMAAEGQWSMNPRVSAWETHHQRNVNMTFCLGAVDILAAEERTAFIHAIAAVKPEVIFIDTLGRTLIGDLNSQRDMQAYIRACDEIQRYFDCSIVLIHHKNKLGTEFGSSYLRNDVDMMIEVFLIDDVIRVECTKTKYSAPPPVRFMKPLPVSDDVVLVEADHVVQMPDDALTVNQSKLLQALAMETFAQGASVEEIMQTTRLAQSTTYHILNKLMGLAFVEKAGDRKFLITDTGRAKLASKPADSNDSNDSNVGIPIPMFPTPIPMPDSNADSNGIPLESAMNSKPNYYSAGL